MSTLSSINSLAQMFVGSNLSRNVASISVHSSNLYEINNSQSNVPTNEAEDLVKHVRGLPQAVHTYTLADATLALSQLAVDPNTQYSPDDLAIVREIGYNWRSDPVLRRTTFTPTTAVFFDAYTRLNELHASLQSIQNRLEALEHPEEHARAQTLSRVFGRGGSK